MPANQQFPTLNGVAPSWADIGISFAPNLAGVSGPPIEAVDIQSLTTGTTIEVGEQRGVSGGRVLNHTLGSATHEGGLVFYRSGWNKMFTALSLVAPRRGRQLIISPVKFDIHVRWTPLGSFEIFQYKVKGARIISRSNNHAEGVDADVVECSLAVTDIVDLDILGNEIVLL